MSLFSKSPKDAPPKADAQANKPAAAPRPAVQRTAPQPGPTPDGRTAKTPGAAPGGAKIADASATSPARAEGGGATPAARPRPAAPAIAIGASAAAPSATPASTTSGSGPAKAADATAPATAPAPAPATASATATAPSRPEAPAAVGSVRPTAPSLSDASGPQVSIADTFERLLSLEDLDEGFAAIQKGSPGGAAPGLAPADLADVRTLFAQLAVNHVRQVRDFMIDLRWRDATSDWIGICEPALRSLRRAAEKLELDALCAALDGFARSMEQAQAGGKGTIDGEHRERLLAAYEALCGAMPQAFALDLDQTQREAVILQSLLLQVPDVKKVTIDKLYAAGLTTMEAMSLATPGDIAATTGIGQAMAADIVARFREYRDRVHAVGPDATRARERERIAELTARLRREHDEYERAAESWARGADEKKKELRKARAQTILDIQVVLARLGEVERLREIERLPFERKVARLESFLEEAREKYVAQS